jgi:hypothetical protein
MALSRRANHGGPGRESGGVHHATLIQMNARLGTIEAQLTGIEARLSGIESRLLYVGGVLALLMTLDKFL